MFSISKLQNFFFIPSHNIVVVSLLLIAYRMRIFLQPVNSEHHKMEKYEWTYLFPYFKKSTLRTRHKTVQLIRKSTSSPVTITVSFGSARFYTFHEHLLMLSCLVINLFLLFLSVGTDFIKQRYTLLTFARSPTSKEILQINQKDKVVECWNFRIYLKN